jgi:hypothetical protein
MYCSLAGVFFSFFGGGHTLSQGFLFLFYIAMCLGWLGGGVFIWGGSFLCVGIVLFFLGGREGCGAVLHNYSGIFMYILVYIERIILVLFEYFSFAKCGVLVEHDITHGWLLGWLQGVFWGNGGCDRSSSVASFAV